MTKEQKETFKLLYKFIHDERSECGNLAALLELRFQDDDKISNTLQTIIIPYLKARQSMGTGMMDVMYQLNTLIEEDTVTKKPQFKFEHTYCSQCGQVFGPGDHGYSHCIDHMGKT